ncbi:uncharacterized protein SPPG_00222 [Spizellomyces punctatus DAOM BR117]|uniref:U6 snRNA-associated Sm-like protein LSm1 n=1 Tax=Spizellomyces punctatus (strain DAOM BR117) TaxID=645134 RepID=A0A0L0HUE6_SPIPD|nr:uncharacterized protein SPPG_00222 [Spizellomyces punctatus DAOM BR117]KND04494.1 hypothetical protein SPPG_00222 [Spizellomyces punctatus DAOM BR117]|eukprot:XP_016612533.1 hypothetical protein SPPG_00222 [Spizellomyces punctatus DAOM BR117]
MDNFLPGSASLVDCVDKKLLVILRDSRKLIGWLRSYDQFANLVLQDTVERTYVGDSYGEVYRGIFVIRGENVVLLGEIDKEKEAAAIGMLRQLPVEEIKELHKREMDIKRQTDKARSRVLQERGFSVDGQEQNDQY